MNSALKPFLILTMSIFVGCGIRPTDETNDVIALLKKAGCEVEHEGGVVKYLGLSESFKDVELLRRLDVAERIEIPPKSSISITDLLHLNHVSSASAHNRATNSIMGITVWKDLKHLNLTGSEVDSLTEVTNCRHLESLIINRSKTDSISFLQNLTCLKTLSIIDCKKDFDFSVLKKLKRLKYLFLDGTRFRTPELLVECKELIRLHANYTRLSSIEFVNELPKLEILGVSNCKQLKKVVLKNNTLFSLDVSFTGLSDLSFINDLSRLEFLDISGLSIQNDVILNGPKALSFIRAHGLNVEADRFSINLDQLEILMLKDSVLPNLDLRAKMLKNIDVRELKLRKGELRLKDIVPKECKIKS